MLIINCCHIAIYLKVDHTLILSYYTIDHKLLHTLLNIDHMLIMLCYTRCYTEAGETPHRYECIHTWFSELW